MDPNVRNYFELVPTFRRKEAKPGIAVNLHQGYGLA